MTIIHRNSLMLRRDARQMREIAAQFRNYAAQGVTVTINAELLLGLAKNLETTATDLARIQEAVNALEVLAAAIKLEKPGER